MNPETDPSPGHSQRRWLWPTVAAAATVLVAGTAAVTMAITGHSTAPQPAKQAAAPAATTSPAGAEANSVAPSASGEPRTYDGAKSVVDKIDAAAKANDGATAWDLMTAAGQATMSRADYIKVTQGCPKLIASNTVLSVALDAGGASATVTVSAPPAQGGQPYTYRLIYEAGHWKRQPSEAAMNWMGLGGDKALIVLRDGGLC